MRGWSGERLNTELTSGLHVCHGVSWRLRPQVIPQPGDACENSYLTDAVHAVDRRAGDFGGGLRRRGAAARELSVVVLAEHDGRVDELFDDGPARLERGVVALRRLGRHEILAADGQVVRQPLDDGPLRRYHLGVVVRCLEIESKKGKKNNNQSRWTVPSSRATKIWSIKLSIGGTVTLILQDGSFKLD